jgi:hypothetical protein
MSFASAKRLRARLASVRRRLELGGHRPAAVGGQLPQGTELGGNRQVPLGLLARGAPSVQNDGHYA